MQAVKTLNEHNNFLAKCLFYTLLLCSTCFLLLLREDAQPVGFIKKQKLEKNSMVPCGSLTKLLHVSSVGISTTGFILGTGLSNRNTQPVQADFTICLIG